MDGDLGQMLQSVLSDPEQMARITQMAQGLMGQGQATAETAPAGPPAPPAPSAAGGTGFSQPDAGVLSALVRSFAPNAGKSRSTALLMAMRPYMKPEKQEKLDRAMRIAQMAHIAGAVVRQYGGGEHGL